MKSTCNNVRYNCTCVCAIYLHSKFLWIFIDWKCLSHPCFYAHPRWMCTSTQLVLTFRKGYQTIEGPMMLKGQRHDPNSMQQMLCVGCKHWVGNFGTQRVKVTTWCRLQITTLVVALLHRAYTKITNHATNQPTKCHHASINFNRAVQGPSLGASRLLMSINMRRATSKLQPLWVSENRRAALVWLTGDIVTCSHRKDGWRHPSSSLSRSVSVGWAKEKESRVEGWDSPLR